MSQLFVIAGLISLLYVAVDLKVKLFQLKMTQYIKDDNRN